MCKYNPGRYSDLDYIVFLDETSMKLACLREEIISIKNGLPNLETNLIELYEERKTLSTEKHAIEDKRASLKNDLRALEAEDKAVEAELDSDLKRKQWKPDHAAARVWLMLKWGAIEDEIEAIKDQRDDLGIERILVNDKRGIVEQGIESLKSDIADLRHKLAKLEADKVEFGNKLRWGRTELEGIRDREAGAA